MTKNEIAKQIVEAVGGAGNIKTLSHCMTRLRFTLKDSSKANDDAAKKIQGVKGISKPAGQYQMIIGTGTVDEYYDAIYANYNIGGSTTDTKDASETKEKLTIGGAISYALGILSGSIGPWLGCIMGSLMITAILSLLTSLHLISTQSPTYQFFSLVSSVCVYSLPILIGFSSAEKLETNKYMGALIGAIMLYPNLMSAISEGSVKIFGLSIRNFSYGSTIVPVILAVWLLKYVEKFAKKICPKVISIFGVTLIELIIVVPLVYLVVGPIGVVITNAISGFVLFINAHAGFLAPAVAGAIMPLAVMAGVHLGLFPIAALMITDVGYDPIIHPALMVYNMSIAGASLAFGLRSKNDDSKSMGISSGISGILGISEAGLFGVVLPNKRILATTEIGILISGIITGLVGYKCYVPLSQSVFSIPAAAHGDFNLMACVISLVSGLVVSFLVTFLFGFSKKDLEEDEATENMNVVSGRSNSGNVAVSAAGNVGDEDIVAPADGEMIDVTTVSDPAFAEKSLGDGVAFRYTGDKVTLCAPANGTLSVLFPTGHAFGITTNTGVELLVHCGINTVEAKGEGFRILGKKQGDFVRAGEPIVEAELGKLNPKYDMSTMLIVTDDNGQNICFGSPRAVKLGQSVLK